MTRLHVFCLACVLAFCGLGTPMTSYGAVGQESMLKAQEALTNADTASALEHLDRAISAMEGAGVMAGSDTNLAVAYYLKANILLAKSTPLAEIEALLNKAVKAAPSYQPEKKYISDPRIISIYNRVLANHNSKGQAAVELAQQLSMQEKHCDVQKLLEPFQNAYGNKKDIGEYLLSVAQVKCRTTDTAAQNEGKLKGLTRENTNRCGLLPVIVKNLPGMSPLKGTYTMENLKRSMQPLASVMPLVEIDREKLDQWQRKNNIPKLEEFAVLSGVTKLDWSWGDFFAGKVSKADVAMGGLPQRLETALANLMVQENLQNILFVFVEAVAPAGSSSTSGPDANILINLFAAPAIQNPKVTHMWKGIPETTAQGKFLDIGKELADQLRKKGR